MSDVIEEIRIKLRGLIEEASTLVPLTHKKRNELGLLIHAYEIWFTPALSLVAQLAPERLQDFRECYKNTTRKKVTNIDYTISDYLQALLFDTSWQHELDERYSALIVRQIGILASIEKSLDTILFSVRTKLRAEIFDSDIAAARELLKAKFFRPAGIVAGVVLEKHLETVANRRGIKQSSKRPTLGNWHETLERANVFDAPMSFLIKRLVEIRNYCAHNKEREPKPDEVEDLLDGVDKVIKEVF